MASVIQPFVQVPCWVLDPIFLTDPELRVYLILLSHYNKEKNRAWPSYRCLCEETGYSRATVSKALNGLEKNKGVIIRHYDEGISTRYEIMKNCLVSPQMSDDAAADGSEAAVGAVPVQPVDDGAAGDATPHRVLDLSYGGFSEYGNLF